METKFKARFGTKNETMNATIHAASCSVAAKSGKHYVCFDVEGATAAEAAANVYRNEDFEERGLAFPKVCKCAR